MKAILIDNDGPRIVEGEFGGLEALQDVVGGYIESIGLEHGAHGYINEEGKMLELYVNVDATKLTEGRLGMFDYIAGPMIVLGDDGEGDESDVPEAAIEWVSRTLGVEL